MPSSSALWASMGPSMQSPMAHTPGTPVRRWPSVWIMPRASSLTPISSRPIPLVSGRRPVATSTASASMVLASPPLTGSMVRRTEPSDTSEPVTLVPRLNFMPCLARMRWNCLATSPSTPGQMRSRNSTTCTSAPNRRHTEPSSSPMMPPPMTTMRSGTLDSESAPVESTMRPASLSTGTGGNGVTSEPVAMTTFLASRVVSPPSVRSTPTTLAAFILPKPFT
mmetsp:Transcript_21850/g.70343  ORF Transcript_21850/g.70343 Transcript_21850/m.70343 type:complete len:223 (-) Transcript_21850:467-1135(-)